MGVISSDRSFAFQQSVLDDRSVRRLLRFIYIGALSVLISSRICPESNIPACRNRRRSQSFRNFHSAFQLCITLRIRHIVELICQTVQRFSRRRFIGRINPACTRAQRDGRPFFRRLDSKITGAVIFSGGTVSGMVIENKRVSAVIIYSNGLAVFLINIPFMRCVAAAMELH